MTTKIVKSRPANCKLNALKGFKIGSTIPLIKRPIFESYAPGKP